jgi:hypothetical protein
VGGREGADGGGRGRLDGGRPVDKFFLTREMHDRAGGRLFPSHLPTSQGGESLKSYDRRIVIPPSIELYR